MLSVFEAQIISFFNALRRAYEVTNGSKQDKDNFEERI